MKKMMYAAAGLLVLTLVSYGVVTFAATQTTKPTKTLTKTIKPSVRTDKLKKFKDLAELKQFLQRQNYSQPQYYREMASGLAPVKAEASVDVAADYSGTNNQVAGVDEADIVKTDGQYIYAVSKNRLAIVKAYPAETAEVLSNIEFKSWPENLYIDGNTLAVIVRDDRYFLETAGKFRQPQSWVSLKIFDISDKKQPKFVRDYTFEGYYNQSRMADGYIYFLTQQHSYNPGPFPLSRVFENGKEISSDRSSQAYTVPPVYYFDTDYSNVSMLTLSAINLRKAEPLKSEVYLLPGSENFYASDKNIYLSYTKRLSERQLVIAAMRTVLNSRLSAADKSLIAKIEAVDEVILSREEKEQKISRILESFLANQEEAKQAEIKKQLDAEIANQYRQQLAALEQTVIVKIAYQAGNFKQVGQAAVNGSVLNQFAFDEQDGYLRLATTRQQLWSEYLNEEEKSSYANVYVLDAQLKQVGAVEKLAVGEQIYASRFMGKRLYLVTFEQVDPLFAIDLSQPNQPKVLGQLKVPGFSRYLHPYDDNTLIGFGQDTEVDKNGRVLVKGLKLSLFDVSNVAQPKELASQSVGGRGSYSAALYDHHAFLWIAKERLAVLPASLTKDQFERWGGLEFNGALVFRVDRMQGIEVLNRISHLQPTDQEVKDNYWQDQGYWQDGNYVKRALFIKDKLYTVSDNQLKINQLNTWELVKELKLGLTKDDIKIINNPKSQ